MPSLTLELLTFDFKHFCFKNAGLTLGCHRHSMYPSDFIIGQNQVYSLIRFGEKQLSPNLTMLVNTVWWVPTLSVRGLLLPWLVADSRLCKLSLQLIFVTLFLEHLDRALLPGARWRRLFRAWARLPFLWRGQTSATAPEARWTPYWVGWLSWGLLRSTCGLAIWCWGWSTNSSSLICLR